VPEGRTSLVDISICLEAKDPEVQRSSSFASTLDGVVVWRGLIGVRRQVTGANDGRAVLGGGEDLQVGVVVGAHLSVPSAPRLHTASRIAQGHDGSRLLSPSRAGSCERFQLGAWAPR
jgi:hypothetical protein